jgi:hypothetical protein
MSVSLQFYKIFNIYMHNDHNMNKKDLQKIIREAIDEVLNEADPKDLKIQANRLRQQALDLEKQSILGQEKDLQQNLKATMAENDLDEMANVAVRYELNPDAAAADFTGKKSRIVAAMQATEEPMSKMDVAGALGYDKQNPINADFMALVADGTIIPSGAQAAPRLNRPTAAEPEDGEDVPAGEEGPEGGVAGDMSDEEIEASFAKAMRSGDEEPEAGEIETGSVTAASMSDDDYEAFMQYTDLESRLAKLKSDILKTKRSRGGVAGDIGDTSSSSIDNMRALKDKLQKKMDSLLASSEYLQKRQAKLTGKEYIKPEPEETEEEPLDEWVKGRMQYYAGIKK